MSIVSLPSLKPTGVYAGGWSVKNSPALTCTGSGFPVSRLNGPMSPGRWHDAQWAKTTGAMSLVKLRGVCAAQGALAPAMTATIEPVSDRIFFSVRLLLAYSQS